MTRRCHACDVRPRQTMHNRENCYKCANPDCPYYNTILGKSHKQIAVARQYLWYESTSAHDPTDPKIKKV